jgi:hypothetical protein
VIPNLVRTTYACFWNISDDLTYSSRRHRETLYVLALNRGMGFKRSFQKDVELWISDDTCSANTTNRVRNLDFCCAP